MGSKHSKSIIQVNSNGLVWECPHCHAINRLDGRGRATTVYGTRSCKQCAEDSRIIVTSLVLEDG